jgi:uncharacterized membrane protein YeiB
MALGGAAASAFGYGGALVLHRDASAHSNTVWEGFGAGGLAVAVIGVLLLATTGGGVVARALWPLASVGRMPLTVYTAQILVLAAFEGAHPGGATDPEEYALLAALVLGSLAFAALWRVFLGKGPLERGMAVLSRLA